jgi:hypothetical protein
MIRNNLVLLITIIGVCHSLRIIEPFEVTLNSPASESRGPLVFNITGQIILSDPEDGCGPILNSNETFGKILIFYLGTCSIEEKMRYSQQVGVIGVISHDTTSNDAGNGFYSYLDYDRSDIVIPMVIVNNKDGITIRALIANSTRVIANIVSGDRNVWKESSQSVAIAVVVAIHCALDLGIASFAIYKYITYTRKKRTLLSVAQVTMWFIIIAMIMICVFRIILLSASNGVFNIPNAIIFLAPFFSDTMILCASLIVSFYWFELTSKVAPMSRAWSKKLWTPFMIGVALSIAMVVLIAFWAQFIRTIETFIIILVIYAVITLGVAIIWIVFGARLRASLLKDTSKAGEKNKQKFKKLIVCIFLSACLLICTRIFTALMGLAAASVITNRAIFEPLQFFFEFNALVILLLFTSNKKSKNSSQGMTTPARSSTQLSKYSSVKSPRDEQGEQGE